MFKSTLNRMIAAFLIVFVILVGWSYHNWINRDTLIVGDFYDKLRGYMMTSTIYNNHDDHTSIRLYRLANQLMMLRYDSKTDKLSFGVSIKKDDVNEKVTFRMYTLVKSIGDLGIYKSNIQ